MTTISFATGLDRAIGWGSTFGGLSPLSFEELAQNVADFFILLVSSVALAVFIWGGLTYITSLGDESRAAKAKRTIAYGIAGMLIAGLALLIEFAVEVIGGFGMARFLTIEDIARVVVDRLMRFIQLLLAPAGVLAFAALVYGGYLYITAAGDEANAARAKRVIFYALLGLIIIGLAGIVTNIVVRLL